MANLFEYEREAIRIKACRIDLDKEDYRKFSVDPNITSFEVLQSILCRAFEIQSGDISINYLHLDRNGKEVWTPLLSDWDLDTAILGSADYGLHLQVKVLEPGCLGEISNMDNKSLVSPIFEAGQTMAKKTFQEVAASAKAASASQVSLAGAGLQGLVSKSSSQASGFFKRHYEQTLPGLASKMRTVLNLDLEERRVEPVYPSVTDIEFRKYLNKVGQMIYPREFRLAVYRGGLEASMRKIAWKHLLNVYPSGMTGGERIRHLRELSQLYSELKSDWMELVLQGRITDDVKTVINMVRKDVLRTDRQHSYYAGEGNHNVTSLFNILTTYALNHPSVSYCQGMSDLASPLLVIMQDEAHAYICFAALMSRMKPNFMLDGTAMTTKFQHLTEGLMYYDPEFYTYLKLHMADDLLFCYRWLLLEMKREFPFEMALKAMEVTWSSLPPATADTKVDLWETRFSPKIVPSKPDLSVKPCETPYGKVAAMRKQSVERQVSDNSAEIKQKAMVKDVTRGRIRSDNSALEKRKATFNKSQSSSSMTSRQRMSGVKAVPNDESGDEAKEANCDPASGGQKEDGSASPPPPGKRLTNLKDFYNLTDAGGKASTTSKVSTAGSSAAAASKPSSAATPASTGTSGDSSRSSRPSSTKASSNSKTTPEKDSVKDNIVSPCTEAIGEVSPCAASPAKEATIVVEEDTETAVNAEEDPFDFVGYSQANTALTIYCNRLPPPTQFGHGNPFLMFLCLSCLLQHRDYIMRNQLDYQDIAMYFDRMVRGHDVDRVLSNARRIFAEYLNEDWSPSPQPGSAASQVPNC